MRMYPLSLKIDGCRCLVVGGGIIAARKAVDLLDCGAVVLLVSPECCERVLEMSQTGRIELLPRCFEPSDVDGMRLVIAATNVREVNEEVSRSAREKGVLVNVVDQPDLCDFYVSAKVRRGDLTVTVNTGGAFPALSKKLRIALEEHIGPEYGPYIELLERLRAEIKASVDSSETRQAIEAALLAEPVLPLFVAGRGEDAERRLRECMEEVRGRCS